MSDETWASVLDPIIGKFDLVAKGIGHEACWNREGSDAMAKLLRRVCEKLDTAADDRAAPDLLAVAHKALAVALMDCGEGPSVDFSPQDLIAEARAAIAKATEPAP